MKKLFIIFAIIWAFCSSALLSQATNTERLVQVQVVPGKNIKLNFKAFANNTPIRIVNGEETINLNIGTSWYDPNYSVRANTDVIKLFGNIKGFNCSNNGDNLYECFVEENMLLEELNCSNNSLTILNLFNSVFLKTIYCENNRLLGLSIANCSNLENVRCFGNPFTKDPTNIMFCALTNRANSPTPGKCYILNTTSDENHSDIIQAYSNAARNKNWQVLYYNNGNSPQNEIPSGPEYDCNSNFVNMQKHITLNVVPGRTLFFKLQSAVDNTKIRIENGNSNEDIFISADIRERTITTNSNTLKFYGNINTLFFSNNKESITGIDISNNNDLIKLFAKDNSISSLNLSSNTRLEVLDCSENNLQSIDVSNNAKLRYLLCNKNQLTTLNLSSNPALSYLECSKNQLTSLNVSSNPNLINLACNENRITSLDVSSNPKLLYLICYKNQISNLTLNNPELKDFTCFTNQLTNLDVSQCPSLKLLYCDNNKLTTLNLNNNTKLVRLEFSVNDISSIDLSHNTKLEKVKCHKNRLTTLNLSNNTALQSLIVSWNPFTAAGINNLYCSLPDRTGSSPGMCFPVALPIDSNNAVVRAATSQIALNKNWQVKYHNYGNQPQDDIPSSGSYDCNHPDNDADVTKYITMKVLNGKQIKLDFKAANNNTPVRIVSGNNRYNINAGTDWYSQSNSSIFTSNADTITIYGNINSFKASDNQANLTEIILTHSAQLSELYCNNNALTFLGINPLDSLIKLDCSNNRINIMTYGEDRLLQEFKCSNNQLTSINLTTLKKLTSLDCSHNRISIFTVETMPALKKFKCNNNNISTLDLNPYIVLSELNCAANRLSNIDISANPLLQELVCYGNQMSTETVNQLYCSLPNAVGDAHKVYTLNTPQDNNHSTIVASTSNNARAKNWQVKYWNNGNEQQNDISSNGSYSCDTGNDNKFITLTVLDGKAIKLDFKAANPNTPVRIVSGNNTQNVIAGTEWYSTANPNYTVTSNGTTMTIYGDIVAIKLNDNQANLTQINLSRNNQITELYCKNNAITSLIVNNQAQLNKLDCSHNQIATIEFGAISSIIDLKCNNNAITTLNTNALTNLTNLNCSNNNLSEINVSSNTRLKELVFYGNKLNTVQIDKLYCSLPNASGTPSKCYPINNENEPNSQKAIRTNGSNATAKNWEVRYWKDGASNQATIATNGIYQCSSTPADTTKFVTVLATRDKNIKIKIKAKADNTTIRIKNGDNIQELTKDASLTELSYNTAFGDTIVIFGDYTEFHCNANNADVSAIDASNNTQLQYIDCSNNQLTSLIIGNNDRLNTLMCHDNKLASLDISNCIDLEQCSTERNQLTNLNVKNCIKLSSLSCSENKLASIDLSRCVILHTLKCDNNQLNALDLNSNKALSHLSCNNNQLSALAISNNTALSELYCNNNSIIDLDISNNTQLATLCIFGNPFTTEILNKIYCFIPEKTGAPGNCYPLNTPQDNNHATIVAATSDNARGKNWNVSYFNNQNTQQVTPVPSNGNFSCSNRPPNMSKYIELVVVQNQDIKFKMKAAEDETPVRIVCGDNTQDIRVGATWDDDNFTLRANHSVIKIYGDLIGFNCNNNGNDLGRIDISSNKNLTELHCNSNRLTQLTADGDIKFLDCSNNQIELLNVSNCSNLETLYCNHNNLRNVLLTNTTKIKDLNCSNNQLAALDVSNNTQLTKLQCSNNQMITLNLGSISKITELLCSNNLLSTINVGSLTALTTFDCSNNQLHLIELGSISEISDLQCNNNLLTTLNISRLTELAKLNCSTNKLTELNPSSNTKLRELVLFDNEFSTLALDKIYCSLPMADGMPGKVFPLNNDNSANKYIIVLSNTENAKAKNWEVKYWNDASNQVVITSKGTYNCSAPETDLSKHITLNVVQQSTISFNCKAIADNTTIRIANGNNIQELSIGADWQTSTIQVNANANTLRIYGNISGFNCSHNTNKVIGIHLSNAPQLKELYCNNNSIGLMDLTNNTNLEQLYCENNDIAQLNLMNNIKLTKINCANNIINYLNVSKNINLEELNCANNEIRHLEFSKNTKLNRLIFYNNKIKTRNIDELFCSLPDRTGSAEGKCFALNTANDNNKNAVIDANSNNATQKNWKVAYYNDAATSETVIETNGIYVCGDVSNTSKYISLQVTRNSTINFKLLGERKKNLIKIESGKKVQAIYINNKWSDNITFETESNELKIYGDVKALDCHSNGSNITQIDIESNDSLKTLYCQSNKISSISFGTNNLLEVLNCSDNFLNTLDLESLPLLDSIFCSKNTFSSVDLKANINLKYADFSHNNINNVNINNPNLQVLKINNNKIQSIDISSAKNLKTFDCFNNMITSLDLGINSNLSNIKCFDNPFTTLSANDLYCSLPNKVDQEKGTIFMLNKNNNTHNNTILATNANIATDKNWDVVYYDENSTAFEAIKTTGTYECGSTPSLKRFIIFTTDAINKPCKLNLTGLKPSTHIRVVNGTFTQDYKVGKDEKIVEFKLIDNKVTVYGEIIKFEIKKNDNDADIVKLTSLDISNNAILEKLYCDDNKLTKLSIKNNINLNELYCSNNAITVLIVGNNNQLSTLQCNNNQLSSLNISNCKNLAVLSCHNNNLTSLDASNKPILAQLICYKNQLSKLNTTDSPKLHEIVCSNNSLTTMDISTNIKLRDLFCSDNKLISLDVSNNSELTNLNATNNQLLTLDINNCKLLSRLYVSNNNISTIDVSNNVELEYLYCENNELSYLDASKCSELTRLNASDNQLTTLDVSKNKKIERLFAKNNKLTNINISNCSIIEQLNISENQINELDLSANTALKELYCSSNHLSALNVQANRELKHIVCYNNLFSTREVDLLYCSLPENTSDEFNKLFILNNESDNLKGIVQSSNSKNAKNKNWKVLYFEGYTDKENEVYTFGTFDCANSVDDTYFYGVTLYPNPANGSVYLRLDKPIDDMLILFDLNGRALLTAEVIAGEANFDVSNLTSGTYFLRVGNTIEKLTVK